jgi:hypothetical protein
VWDGKASQDGCKEGSEEAESDADSGECGECGARRCSCSHSCPWDKEVASQAKSKTIWARAEVDQKPLPGGKMRVIARIPSGPSKGAKAKMVPLKKGEAPTLSVSARKALRRMRRGRAPDLVPK